MTVYEMFEEMNTLYHDVVCTNLYDEKVYTNIMDLPLYLVDMPEYYVMFTGGEMKGVIE